MNVAPPWKCDTDEEPWKVIKDNPERVQTQMYVALQIAAALSAL
jgi:methionyl-tRNA synthetase